MREHLKSISWPAATALGLFALVRPLLSITGAMDQLGRPVTPIVATVGISVVWILVAGLSRRVRSPVATLAAAGVVYSAATIVLSGILSPILTGHLQGPLAVPYGIIPMTLVNVVWGLAAGALALVLRQALRTSSARSSRTRR